MNLGFLASHGGSNMQAILDACSSGQVPAHPRLLICNNAKAKALARAEESGLPAKLINQQTHPDFAQRDLAIRDALLDAQVQLVILAGYMKKIGPALLEAYQNRILNIHPSLLPSFGGQGMYGLRVHAAVLSAGEAQSGASVHIVDADYDGGPVLSQAKAPVLEGDTPETLQARVLEQEHRLYPATIAAVAKGELKLP